VLLREIWANTVESFVHSDYVRDEYVDLLDFAETAEEAVAKIVVRLGG
jgi:hypothetical protein